MKPIRVVLADDNAVIRMGLVSLLALSERVEIVGEAGDGEQAIEMIQRLQPEVALLDVQMPKCTGVQVAAAVGHLTKVLMLTYSDQPEIMRAAIEAGADGYLVHGQFESADLERAIVTVAQGAMVLSSVVAESLRAAWAIPAATPPRPDLGLSVREQEIMELIAKGQLNTEIAKHCHLSVKTVKNHINSIFAKLGVDSRQDAMARWKAAA